MYLKQTESTTEHVKITDFDVKNSQVKSKKEPEVIFNHFYIIKCVYVLAPVPT